MITPVALQISTIKTNRPDDLAAELATFLAEQKVEGYITEDVVLVAEYASRMIGFTHLSAINIPVDTPVHESRQLRRLYVHREFQNRGIGYHWSVFRPNGQTLEEVRRYIEEGKIRPVIDKTFTFEQMPNAHRYIETGHARQAG